MVPRLGDGDDRILQGGDRKGTRTGFSGGPCAVEASRRGGVRGDDQSSEPSSSVLLIGPLRLEQEGREGRSRQGSRDLEEKGMKEETVYF